MLRWALIFLVLGLIAAVLGFTSIAGTSIAIAKVLFFIFLAIFVVPVLFVVITRFAYGKKQLEELQNRIPKVDYDHNGEGYAH